MIVEGIDLDKQVKYKEPFCSLEKDLVFVVTNYNEVTKRCYIRCINSGMAIASESLVSINDIINV